MHVQSFEIIDHIELKKIIIEQKSLIHGILYITRKFDSITYRSK